MGEGCLFNLFVNSDTLENGIVLLQLKTLGGVLAVFGGNVSGCTGHAAGFVLGALENNLNAVTFSFLCHGGVGIWRGGCLKIDVFDLGEIALLGCVLNGCVEAFLVDGAKTGSADGEYDPGLLFNPEELLGKEVYVEFALGATLRVRNVVAYNRFFACDLTNL